MATDFRNLDVWKISFKFALDIYELTEKFPKSEQYNITQQLRRASTSISTNIAEGCGKATIRDVNAYFRVAVGSIKECMSLLMLSKELKYLNEKEFDEIFDKANHIGAMLTNLIKSREKFRFDKKFKKH